ncbi:MAG: hypothetical protein BGP08_01265 [Rhizobiales bacterium 64-17]|nr:MAG: hypothetical protein BGP08_01265 [Rhizobiales bacterium 64-17]
MWADRGRAAAVIKNWPVQTADVTPLGMMSVAKAPVGDCLGIGPRRAASEVLRNFSAKGHRPISSRAVVRRK